MFLVSPVHHDNPIIMLVSKLGYRNLRGGNVYGFQMLGLGIVHAAPFANMILHIPAILRHCAYVLASCKS